jgi:hypothetical protein
MTINMNIKYEAYSCPYPLHFLRVLPGVFRSRDLQFVLIIGGYFIFAVGNRRKRTKTNHSTRYMGCL